MAISSDSQIAAVNAKLEKLYGKLARPIVANKAASIALYGQVIRNFDADGAMYGLWAALAPATVRQKERIGKEKMLVRTGHLRAGFVPFHDDHNAGVRNEVEYAAAHQFGVPERNLPARNMLPPRDAVLETGIKVYQFYVAQAAREANA